MQVQQMDAKNELMQQLIPIIHEYNPNKSFDSRIRPLYDLAKHNVYVHEASHAVYAVLAEHAINYAVAKESGDGLVIMFPKEIIVSNHKQWYKEIMVTLAGIAAETLMCEHLAKWGWIVDLDSALHYGKFLLYSQYEVNQTGADQDTRIVRIVSRVFGNQVSALQRNVKLQQVIRIVAAAFRSYGYLNGREVQVLIRRHLR